MRNFENMYEQYQAGILSETRWDSTRNIIDYIFTTGGVYCWYREADNPRLLTGEFGDIIEEAYDTSPFTDQNITCPDLPALVEN